MSLRISGNRLLKTLPGQEIRPTAARTRAALFNIWQGKIPGCTWLDLCAGSGSMGAEALYRGAKLVVGIEQSAPACAVIEQNWRRIAKPEQTFRVLQGTLPQRLAALQGQQFDRIYFDPPYQSGLYQPVLAAIGQHQLLSANGELVAEHGADNLNADFLNFEHFEHFDPVGWHISRQKRYGRTGLTFYRCHHD